MSEDRIKEIKSRNEKTLGKMKDELGGKISNEKIYKTMNVIRSRKHEIYSETINKIALTSPSEDNKNYNNNNFIHSIITCRLRTLIRYNFFQFFYILNKA
jgi:hypothetical protein